MMHYSVREMICLMSVFCKTEGKLSNVFTLCFGVHTVFLTQISLVHCQWYLQINIALFILAPSKIRSVLRNGASPLVVAKTHDIGSLCANTCLVLKGMLVFGISLSKDMS